MGLEELLLAQCRKKLLMRKTRILLIFYFVKLKIFKAKILIVS